MILSTGFDLRCAQLNRHEFEQNSQFRLFLFNQVCPVAAWCDPAGCVRDDHSGLSIQPDLALG